MKIILIALKYLSLPIYKQEFGDYNLFEIILSIPHLSKCIFLPRLYKVRMEYAAFAAFLDSINQFKQVSIIFAFWFSVKEYFLELDRNKQILEIERMAESFLKRGNVLQKSSKKVKSNPFFLNKSIPKSNKLYDDFHP